MRDFIAFCLLMTCLTVSVASTIALFKPLPKVWLGNRAKALRGFGVSFILLVLVIIVIPTPESTEQNDEISQEKSVAASEIITADDEHQESGIGITLEEFRIKFNEHSAALKRPWRIENPKISDGTFSYLFNNNIAVSGLMNSSGEFINIVVIGSGDGTAMSGLDVFSVMTASYAAALKHDDMKTVAPILLEMMQSSKEGGEASKIMNNIKASYARSDVIGNILTISSASE